MHVPFVDLKAQYLSIKGEIDDAIRSVIDGDLFVGGEAVGKFEMEFANYLGMDFCISCANGTDALEVALKALGIGQGDEVIVPALTWISTAGAVNNVGAEPIFVDVLSDQRTIDPSSIEERITSKTKAIIPVHLYGLPVRMNEIIAVAKTHNLKVIEDCAQAHGAEIHGRKVGTFGDIATFSFYPTKNLGAYGDGGAITMKDEILAGLCRKYTNHGQLEKHNHQIIGRNSKLDSIQAAILSVKLKYLDGWNEQRVSIAETYSSELKNVKVPRVPNDFKHVFHLYVIQSEERDQLKARLEKEGIETTIHYPKPLPFVEAYQYKNHQKGEFPVAEKLCGEVLSLPVYEGMGENRIKCVLNFFNNI